MSLPIFSLILLRRIAKVFVPKPILTLTDSKNGLWGLQSIKVWEHLLCNFSPQIHFHQTFPLFIHCLDVVFYQSKACRPKYHRNSTFRGPGMILRGQLALRIKVSNTLHFWKWYQQFQHSSVTFNKEWQGAVLFDIGEQKTYPSKLL